MINAVTNSSCTSAPTYTPSSSLISNNLSGVGMDFTNNVQGGYNTTGRVVNGAVNLATNAGGTTKTTQNIYTVSSI